MQELNLPKDIYNTFSMTLNKLKKAKYTLEKKFVMNLIGKRIEGCSALDPNSIEKVKQAQIVNLKIF